MYKDEKIVMGKNGDKEFYILPKLANRHGFISGATGSGKTITLKVMAESFSNCGVPVFLADVKGDLAGMCLPGDDTEDMKKRIQKFSLEDSFKYQKFPTEFYDISRKKGLPVRTTISEFGPLLLSYILELNDVQSDLMNVLFKLADDSGLFLIDIKDLKALLSFMSEHTKELSETYGNISKTSVASILRAIVALEQEGLELLFGEPSFDINDFFRVNEKGQGYINILHSEDLILSPKVYSAFLLWLLSSLFSTMPELGDVEKPKIVFFFDEAHLLFKDASKALLKKIDQVTKLIRSKGVGLYYITQDPTDIPDTILQQLGNKIQHVYRAYTAKDRRNLKAIASSFRENKDLDLEDVIQNLGTGEAVVSFLDEKGIPNVVEFAKILPPESKMGIIDDSTRDNVMKQSLMYNKYNKDVDRESAYELLLDKSKKREKAIELGLIDLEEEAKKEAELQKKEEEKLAKEQAKAEREAFRIERANQKKNSKPSVLEKTITSSVRTATGSIGRQLATDVAKSVFGNNKVAKQLAGNLGANMARNLFGSFFMGK